MALSQGVTSSRFPYVQLDFRIRQYSFSEEALLDTGFDGGIAVPSELLGDAVSPDGYEFWQPVVGSPVLAPTYRATCQINALGPFPVAVTAMGDEVLVGLEALSRFVVTLDHGQRVVVAL